MSGVGQREGKDGVADAKMRADLAYRITGRRIGMAACFVLALPMALFGAWVSGSEVGGFIGVGVCVIPLLVLSIALTLTQCPRCRHMFFMSQTGWMNMWASECLSCGLSLRSEGIAQDAHSREGAESSE